MGVRDFAVDSNGVKIAAREYGGAGRPVILVHGGPNPNLGAWEGFAPRLTNRFRVFAYDQRGHGLSDAASDYSYPTLAADVEAVVRTLGIEAPLIVGHSWGGQIALVYGSLYRSAAGIVAIDGPVTDAIVPMPEERLRTLLEQGLRSEPLIAFVGSRHELDALIDRLKQASAPGGFSEATARRQMVEGPDGLWRCRRTIAEIVEMNVAVNGHASYLATDLYASIVCPVMLIGASQAGEGNPRWPFRKEAVAQVVERHPHVREEWLDGGHFLPAECPEDLVALIEDFATSLPT